MDTPTQSSSSGPWFAVSMGLLGLIAGYALATGLNGSMPANGAPAPTPPAQGNNNVPTPPPTTAKAATADDDAVLGDKNAKVTIIEFTDFQCPFCSRHFSQTFGQIKTNYIDTGKVKYVSRDFPLGFHPNAQKAAETSECADEQGKFWQMHDKLFTSQGEWSNLGSADAATKFKQYAADLGLNAAKFADCFDNGKMKAEIAKDQQDGSDSGIDGTPGFWILGPNGQTKQISGAYPYATFQATIDEYLK
jgi:protein-disulfide isomerase